MGIRNFLLKLLTKESATSRVLVTGGSGTMFAPKRYDQYAKETYLKNLIAFKAMDEVAKCVAMVPWGLFERGKDGKVEEIMEHEILTLLSRPNPYDSFPYLMLKSVVFHVMNGNAFWEKVSASGVSGVGPVRSSGAFPKELYVHRPDRMKIKVNPDSGMLEVYEYSTGVGEPVEWPVDAITQRSDILHVKGFHPTEDWWGGSATEPAGREIDISNDAVDMNRNLIQNYGRLGNIYMFENNLGDVEFERLKTYLRDNYNGPHNAGKDLLLEGGGGKVSVERAGFSLQDMDFIEGNRELARKICYGYGVPPMLIGIPGDNTYSNYREARSAFFETTVLWYLMYYKGEFNNWIFGEEENLFLDFDLDAVPALEHKRESKWERAQKSEFLTLNEKRRMTGYDDIEGGDVILIPASMIPLGSEPDGSEGEEGDEDDKPKKPPKEDEEEDEDAKKKSARLLEERSFTPCDLELRTGEHVANMTDPEGFDRFVRSESAVEVAGKAVAHIYGIREGGGSDLVRMCFRRSLWPPDEAREYAERRGGQFVAAGDVGGNGDG